jgi:hypothetical protein
MIEADWPAASGEAARTAQGGLAVRIQFRRAQPMQAAQAHRSECGVSPVQNWTEMPAGLTEGRQKLVQVN